MPCLCAVQLRMCAHDVYVLLAGCVCVYVRVLLAGCVCACVCAYNRVHIHVCTHTFTLHWHPCRVSSYQQLTQAEMPMSFFVHMQAMFSYASKLPPQRATQRLTRLLEALLWSGASGGGMSGGGVGAGGVVVNQIDGSGADGCPSIAQVEGALTGIRLPRLSGAGGAGGGGCNSDDGDLAELLEAGDAAAAAAAVGTQPANETGAGAALRAAADGELALALVAERGAAAAARLRDLLRSADLVTLQPGVLFSVLHRVWTGAVCVIWGDGGCLCHVVFPLGLRNGGSRMTIVQSHQQQNEG